jgi:hypothetical protein
MFSIPSDVRANKMVKEMKTKKIKYFLSFNLKRILLGGLFTP